MGGLALKIIDGKPAAPQLYRTEQYRSPQFCEVSDIVPQKPLEYVPQAIEEAEMKLPVRCVPKRISDLNMKQPIDSHPRRISDMEIMESMEGVLPVRPDAVSPKRVEKVVQVAEITSNPLQAADARVLPATQELGQMFGEDVSQISNRAKRQKFTETIMHITDTK